MPQAAKFLHLERKDVNIKVGLVIGILLFIPLVVLNAFGLAEYWISFSFALILVAMADPGGAFPARARIFALSTVAGAILTAIGFVLGSGNWVAVTVALFVVSLLSGFAAAFGKVVGNAAGLVNGWFIFALVLPADMQEGLSFAIPQAIAFLAGGVLWMLLTWFMDQRRKRGQTQPLPAAPVPEKTRAHLSRPIVLFSLLRSVAIAFAGAIAWGFNLPEADWMPLSAAIVIRPDLEGTLYHGLQRAVGTVLGGLLGALILVFAPGLFILALAVVVFGSICMAFYKANYTYYAFCMTCALVIGESLSNPTSLTIVAERVLFVLIGVVIGVGTLFIADLAQKRATKTSSRSTVGQGG